MPIEQISQELEHIVYLDSEVEELARELGITAPFPFGTGYGAVCEGPVWWKEGGYLVFSDVPNNRRMQWSPTTGITVYHDPSNNSNGLTRDPQGRLIACEHRTRRVIRMEPDGSTTVVANKYHGKRLNRPNDVVVKSDGSIYFTDPYIPQYADGEPELDCRGIYRVSPDLGTINLLVWDFASPNGLAFSPDESILYINDSSRKHIRAFDVQSGGLLAIATDRIFCEFSGERPGNPDGMKVDTDGNVYCTGPGGIWIINPSGSHLGTILTGAPAFNMAWGGKDWRTIFFTTPRTLGRIYLKVTGIPVPCGKP